MAGTLGGVLLVVYVVVALINSTLVQSFTAAKVAEHFSKEWKTKVSIGALEIRPWLSVALKDVYLEDRQGDVIADVGYLSASLRSFTLPNAFHLSTVRLEDVTYVLATKNGRMNLAFILDYFKSDKPKPPKPKGEPFVLTVDRLRMKNVNFRMDNCDNPAPIPDFGVATNHLQFSKTDAWIENISVVGDSITADFKRFATEERCGQKVKELSGGFVVSPRGIRCHNMHLKTEDSDVRMQAEIRTSSWGTYSHFVDSAYCVLNIEKSSIVSVRDASYWAQSLKGFDQTFQAGCTIRGTVADAAIETFSLSTSDTRLALSGSIKGLPDIGNTVFDVDLQVLETSAEDFNSFKLGEKLAAVKLPKMLEALGRIAIKGDFHGLLDSFLAKADIQTALGNVNLSARSNPDRKTAKTLYDCELKSSSFNVGKLLSNPMLSTTAVNLTASVVPGGLKELALEAEAELGNLHLNGNNYNSVFLDAEMEKGVLEAQLDIIDDAVLMNLNCSGNVSELEDIRLQADITEANLSKIGFFTLSDTTAELSTSLYVRADKLDLENLSGFVDFKDTKIRLADTTLAIEYLNLRTKNDSTANMLRLKSDFADMRLEGRYSIAQLAGEIGGLVNRYKPDLELISSSKDIVFAADSTKAAVDIRSRAEVELKVKDISVPMRLLGLDAGLEGGLVLNGRVNPEEILAFDLKGGEFGYGAMRFERINVTSETNRDGFSLLVGLERAQLGDSLAIDNPKVSVKLNGNDFRVLTTFGREDESELGGRLDLQAYLTSTGLQASFNDSYILVAKDKIGFNDNHLINYQGGRLSFMNFALVKGRENLVINGDVSESRDDRLTITFKDLDLADFNPILAGFELNVQGLVNDKVVLRSVLKNMTLTSGITIDDLVINGVQLGKTKLGVSNMFTQDEFATDISMVYSDKDGKQTVPLAIKGSLKPYNEEENLDLKVSMQGFDIKLAESYLSSLSSYVRGRLSTKDLSVKGRFTSPHIVGRLKFDDAAIKIDMLNTTYSFSDEVVLNDSVFTLKDFILKDVQQNKVVINGNVTHSGFSDFALNLNAKADKLKILDTDESSDQMYYGSVYASADVNLHGDLDFLNIEVAAKTERGTSLTVPISSKTSASESSYITFASNASDQEQSSFRKSEESGGSMGYRVVVDLNVNPNAQLLIPMNFNQLKGDLTAAGNGDLRIEVGSDVDMSMLGTVEVDNGSFKMSVMDMMTKVFEIERGGTLSWSGAPSDGQIDLQAIYKTKASLAPVLGQEYSKAVDVQSVILLSGSMTNPQPKFDIRLPNTDDATVERLFMNIDRNDERAMLEQTASLLFLHQFYSSEGAAENSIVETGLSSAFEAAFGQVSGMLSDLIKVVDVGMNYTRGADGTSDRMDFSVSKDYGRVVVNANAGFSSKSEADANQMDEIMGDAYVEYKVTDNFRIRVFNRSNANDFTKYNIAPYTQGVGLFYHRQYDKFGDIFKRKKKTKQ